MAEFAPSIQTTETLDPMLPRPWRVSRSFRETYDTFTMELAPEKDGDTFDFEPGQFNMLYVFGIGEIPISISGDPAHREMLVHTTRVVGTVTRALGDLKRGDALGVRGPFGQGWPTRAVRGSDLVFVAGGIGLAPLRPALHEVITHREKYGKIVLLYGTRSPEDILFREQLEKWRARFDLDIFVTVDYADTDWHGSVGVVTKLIEKAPFDAEHAVAMVCGPEVMMRFSAAELLKRGVRNDSIYMSMERNMKCAVGFCGHCQFGPTFICCEGPVYPYTRIGKWINAWEV